MRVEKRGSSLIFLVKQTVLGPLGSTFQLVWKYGTRGMGSTVTYPPSRVPFGPSKRGATSPPNPSGRDPCLSLAESASQTQFSPFAARGMAGGACQRGFLIRAAAIAALTPRLDFLRGSGQERKESDPTLLNMIRRNSHFIMDISSRINYL